MVFKRYIKRDGKKFGPYLYESYRDKEGNVKKRYVGKSKHKHKSKLILPVVLGLFFILALIVILNYQGIVGRVIINVKESYLEINLKKGELLPMSSKILVSQGDSVKEFLLSDLVSGNAVGDFYVENKNISGSGEGYGLVGEMRVYPKVYFTIILRDETSDSGGVISEEEPDISDSTETTTEDEEETTTDETTETETTDETEEVIEETEETEETVAEETTETEEEATDEETTTDETTIEETTETEETETTAESTPEPSSDDGVITGEAVSESEEVWRGSVSADETFELNLKNQIAILEGPVYSDYENLSVGILSLKLTEDKATVSTDYYISEEGFGEEYLEDENNYINLDLDKLGIDPSQNGTISIKLVYQDIVLSETSAEIKAGKAVRKPLFDLGNETVEIPENITSNEFKIIKEIGDISLMVNSNYTINLDNYFLNAESYSVEETINISVQLLGSEMIIAPNTGFVGSESVKVSAYSENETLSQEFLVMVSDSKVLVSTKQYKAVINKPVKWVKTMKIGNDSASEDLTINIPREAKNITLKTGGEARDAVDLADGSDKIVESADRKDIADGKITGFVSIEIKKKPGLLTKFWFWLRGSMTGRVVYDEQYIKGILNETGEDIAVDISSVAKGSEGDIAVEYETPGPVAVEEDLENGKRIVVSADDEYNYTDILAYTELDNRISINEQSKIKLYWYNTENQGFSVPSRTNSSGGNETGEVVKELVDFDAYDLDADGDVDYIEWVGPHLSEQVYEIIYITKAVELDSNRDFVRDVYDYVSSLDDNVTLIGDGNYLRVTFEKNLTNQKDITIYARVRCSGTIKINNIDVPCEIYYEKMRIDELRRENG
ncbi:MAG: hypothetical protein ABH840_00730 [Nanoarchaeota archaeon]